MAKITETQILVTQELKKDVKNKRNKIILGSFLGIAILALLMRIGIGVLLDMGLINGKFHIGFWRSPQIAFQDEFHKWQIKHGNGSWADFLNADANRSIKRIILRHPNFLWFSTQFTWITTIIIIIFLTFRFFKYDESVPKWLGWIMRQRTLSLVTMYDLVVAIVFWSSMYKGFANAFSNTLVVPEIFVTVLAHAVIPVCILSYSIIYLVKDEKASILKEFFALKGLIFPILYSGLYLLVTIVWNDPYPTSNFHEKLVSNPKGDWGAWASELWKIVLVLVVIYVMLCFMILFHNIILTKFNKSYDPARDYETLKDKKEKLQAFKKKIIRTEIKKWKENK